MQSSMHLFSASCNNFGLTINTKKIEVIFHPALVKPHQDLVIAIDRQKLEAVAGSLNWAALMLAKESFGKLCETVWN